MLCYARGGIFPGICGIIDVLSDPRLHLCFSTLSSSTSMRLSKLSFPKELLVGALQTCVGFAARIPLSPPNLWSINASGSPTFVLSAYDTFVVPPRPKTAKDPPFVAIFDPNPNALGYLVSPRDLYSCYCIFFVQGDLLSFLQASLLSASIGTRGQRTLLKSSTGNLFTFFRLRLIHELLLLLLAMSGALVMV